MRHQERIKLCRNLYRRFCSPSAPGVRFLERGVLLLPQNRFCMLCSIAMHTDPDRSQEGVKYGKNPKWISILVIYVSICPERRKSNTELAVVLYTLLQTCWCLLQLWRAQLGFQTIFQLWKWTILWIRAFHNSCRATVEEWITGKDSESDIPLMLAHCGPSWP